MKDESSEKQLADFMSRYTPEIANLAELVLSRMRAHLPGAIELVYDNYNALAIGFGPTERASDAIFSIALFPRWVSLFFLQGANLPDPKKILKGKGKVARHIVLNQATDIDNPAVQQLIKLALKQAAIPLDATKPRHMVIKSISAKQRPRRPVSSGN